MSRASQSRWLRRRASRSAGASACISCSHDSTYGLKRPGEHCGSVATRRSASWLICLLSSYVPNTQILAHLCFSHESCSAPENMADDWECIGHSFFGGFAQKKEASANFPHVMQDGADQSCTELKRVRLRRGNYSIYLIRDRETETVPQHCLRMTRRRREGVWGRGNSSWDCFGHFGARRQHPATVIASCLWRRASCSLRARPPRGALCRRTRPRTRSRGRCPCPRRAQAA